MGTRTCLLRARSAISRPQSIISRNQTLCIRFASDDASKTKDQSRMKGPNMDQLPHVSEEQAAMDKVMGEQPPDLEQGTPVQEILKRDKDAQQNAPQVIKEKMQKPGTNQKRSYSTTARRRAQELVTSSSNTPGLANGMLPGLEYPDAGPGHKFALPVAANMSRLDHLRRRYDPVVDQVTKSLMRHGKLSEAQKNMNKILNTLRTAPPPQANPSFPGRTLLLSDTATTAALPTSPNALQLNSNSITSQTISSGSKTSNTPDHVISLPRAVLPLHPIEYLTTTIDSVAPLLKIRQQRGVAGGGASLPIPVPLGIRQRRRQAIQWILTAADGRRETKLADRVAREIISVAEGKSGVWERRAMAHRLAVSARSNIRTGGMKTRKRM